MDVWAWEDLLDVPELELDTDGPPGAEPASINQREKKELHLSEQEYTHFIFIILLSLNNVANAVFHIMADKVCFTC